MTRDFALTIARYTPNGGSAGASRPRGPGDPAPAPHPSAVSHTRYTLLSTVSSVYDMRHAHGHAILHVLHVLPLYFYDSKAMSAEDKHVSHHCDWGRTKCLCCHWKFCFMCEGNAGAAFSSFVQPTDGTNDALVVGHEPLSAMPPGTLIDAAASGGGSPMTARRTAVCEGLSRAAPNISLFHRV